MKFHLLFLVLASLTCYSNADIVRISNKGNRVCIKEHCYRESISNTLSSQFVFEDRQNKKYLNAEYFDSILVNGKNHNNILRFKEGYKYILDKFIIPKTKQFSVAFNIMFDQPILVTITDNDKILAETTSQNYFQTFNVLKTNHQINIYLTALEETSSNPMLNKGYDYTRKVWVWYGKQKGSSNHTNPGVFLTNVTTLTLSSILYTQALLN